MREALKYTGEISKVVVSKRNGRWFVSILVQCDSNNYKHQPLLFTDTTVKGGEPVVISRETVGNSISLWLRFSRCGI